MSHLHHNLITCPGVWGFVLSSFRAQDLLKVHKIDENVNRLTQSCCFSITFFFGFIKVDNQINFDGDAWYPIISFSISTTKNSQKNPIITCRTRCLPKVPGQIKFSLPESTSLEEGDWYPFRGRAPICLVLSRKKVICLAWAATTRCELRANTIYIFSLDPAQIGKKRGNDGQIDDQSRWGSPAFQEMWA